MDALLDAIALQSRAITSEEWQGQGIAKQLSNRVHTSYVMNRVRSGGDSRSGGIACWGVAGGGTTYL